MAEVLESFAEKLGGLAGKWTAYAAMGTFILYLLGYLTLRFQLTAYGLATNLDVFDEKYLFAGCRFLVYLVTSIPNILIILLALAVVGYLPYRLVPQSAKLRIRRRVSSWFANPLHSLLLGIVIAVALIQFVLRKCFAFDNMLLRKQLPDEWLSSVLLASDGKLTLYFSGLVAGTLLTGAILVYAMRRETPSTAPVRIASGLLVFLFAVEFLLLPVNYGILISTQQLPRVAELSADDKPSPAQADWLVWDSKDAVTYFVRDGADQRFLVTVPKKDAKLRVTAYDDIFCLLFAANQVESRPCPR
jgi:hypothetical protein